MSILVAADFTDDLFIRLGGDAVLSDAHKTLIQTKFAPRVETAVKKFVGYNIEQATYTEFYPIEDERSPESPLDRNVNGVMGSSFNTIATLGSSELYVKQLPLRAVTSVYENQQAWITDPVNGDFSAGYLLNYGSDYTVDWDEAGLSESGAIMRFGPWPRIKRTVKVTYLAGWTAAELLSTDRLQSIKEAILVTLQIKYLELTALARNPNTGGIGMVASETLADYSISFDATMWAKIFGLQQELPPQAKSMLREFVTMRKFVGR